MSWTPPSQYVDRYEIQAIALDQGLFRRNGTTPRVTIVVHAPGVAINEVIYHLQQYTLYEFDVISIVDFNGETTSGSSTLPTDQSELRSVAVRTLPACKFYFPSVPTMDWERHVPIVVLSNFDIFYCLNRSLFF